MTSKKAAYRFGLHAETLSALFLRIKGYRIIARRHKNHAGEIDIIAKRRNLIVFIEVKARSNAAHIGETLSLRQQQRIIRSAEVFLQHHPRFTHYSVRFDMMQISPFRWPIHLKDAWRGW